MTLIGSIRLMDGQHQRGTVSVSFDADGVILSEERDGIVERRHLKPHVAEKLGDWLNAAADKARGS